MKIIVGLGNPGKEYQNTPHNTGFMVVEKIQEIKKLRNWKLRENLKALISNNKIFLLVKPQTFMNSSGLAVKKVLDYYFRPPPRSPSATSEVSFSLYVIHDDLDLPLGSFKIQFGKGPKNHGGINSIEKHLKTKNFWRVRIGTERVNKKLSNEVIKGEDYVLRPLSKMDLEILKQTIKKAVKEII